MEAKVVYIKDRFKPRLAPEVKKQLSWGEKLRHWIIDQLIKFDEKQLDELMKNYTITTRNKSFILQHWYKKYKILIKIERV